MLDSRRVPRQERRLIKFENVVHLKIVAHAAAVSLGEQLLHALGAIAVVVAILEVGAVLQLLLDRKLEDFLADGELVVDFVLRQPKVDDVEEAD